MTTLTTTRTQSIAGIGLNKIALVAMLALVLGACAQAGPKTAIGAAGGAAAGGLIGAAAGGGAEGIIAGVLLGGLLGGAIGNTLDQRDREFAARSQNDSLERYQDGQQSSWNNPNTGHYGSTTPTRTYQRPSGQYCREFQQSVTVDGQSQNAFGTACRQPDGSWQIVQ